MRILVACEYSGVVRDAFLDRGHDAYSCDLLPCDSLRKFPNLGCLENTRHYQCDVREVIEDNEWDMMIAHPPCDYLTVSCNRWFSDDAKAKLGILVGAERRQAREEAVEFVKYLYDCKIPKIAIENPIGRLSTLWRRPDQIVQPWMFGHPEQKATCLWLKGLRKLRPTDNVYDYMMTLPKSQRERGFTISLQARRDGRRGPRLLSGSQNPWRNSGDNSMKTPVAWMRKWYHDGEKEYKTLNKKTGRMRRDPKFNWLPVSKSKILPDDLPLYLDEKCPHPTN